MCEPLGGFAIMNTVEAMQTSNLTTETVVVKGIHYGWETQYK
jgi:hypothetical protein